MRFILSAVCFYLTLFGSTQIRAQDQLTTSASPAANSAASKPTTSQPQPGLSDVKILRPGDSAATPTTATASSPEPSLYLKGLTFLDTGNNAEAVEALRQAVEHDPNDAAAYGKLGVAYAALGQYKEAVVALKMAIRIKPEIVDAEDYYHLSRSYTALGPAMADLHYSAGLAFYNLKRFREANEESKQVIALNPKHAPGHFGLG